MSASPVSTFRAVTQAPVRRRAREVQARGPQARPARLAAPGGRPVQSMGPSVAGGPVQLRLAQARRMPRAAGGVQLTDRGILLVSVLMGALLLGSLVVGVVSFFGVSDAPLDDAPTVDAPGVTLVVVH